VAPPGLVQSPSASITSIIAFVFIGSFGAASTCAAASRAETFFPFGALDAFAGLAFFA
jgi:hypothetical protein